MSQSPPKSRSTHKVSRTPSSSRSGRVKASSSASAQIVRPGRPTVTIVGKKAKPAQELRKSVAASKTKGWHSDAAQRGILEFTRKVNRAGPMEIVELERHGVRGDFLKDLSRHMSIPASRFYTIIGLPKATAEKKAAEQALVSGSSGHSAIAITKLIGMVEAIATSGSPVKPADFDAAKWLGKWIERPQPALGGCAPADLLGTPTGIEIVARLLGAMQSGAYQ